MILYTVAWKLAGKPYSETRVHDKPDVLKRQIESLACREWPITDVTVEPVSKGKK